jgi:methionyl aminopeptidase
MIILKTDAEIEVFKEAGRISAKVLRLAGLLCRPGISTLEIDDNIEMLIRMEGALPAFKGLYGFPGSACISPNEMIVHGIPSKHIILKEGDIVSIDTGAIVDGWVGDNAWTFPVGKISPEKRRLLDVTEQCMWDGLAQAVADNHLGDIGHTIQTRAENAGYGVVREYVGHGVGRAMHEDPNVPNFGKAHHGLRLQRGMTLAIEPMINIGTARTKRLDDGWGVVTADGLPSAHFEKTVAITVDGPFILTSEDDAHNGFPA